MLLMGIDEAGRGPVIGSMMIAGVLIDSKDEERLKRIGVKDSKMLTRKQRESMAKEIEKIAREIKLVEITAREIDTLRKTMSLNEIEARKIVELMDRFENRPDKIYIDCPDPITDTFVARLEALTDLTGIKLVVEHKADVKYPVVSAASIIAKVARDLHVDELGKRYNVKMGTGYPHDELAIKAIERYLEKDGKLPPFVRKSWDTAKRLVERRQQKKMSDF